jgi:hypothetical protein
LGAAVAGMWVFQVTAEPPGLVKETTPLVSTQAEE